MVGLAVAKQGLVYLGKSLPQEECRIFSGGLFGMGLSAGINNLLVIGGITTPGLLEIGGTLLQENSSKILL